MSDVYFLTGLSRRGPVPQLTGRRPSEEKMDEVKARVCPEAKYGLGSSKVDIPTVQDLTLRAFLFTFTRDVGAQAPHEAMKNHLLLAMECLSPTIFNWASAVTTNMKRQLTKAKQGKLQLFGYGSILVTFFLECVPRGLCSRPSTSRAEDGSMGGTDAEGWWRPADVL